ncbi:hypothetical protein A3I99_01985 [Candidatus Kaiserbacteria bacterium RIFCSPLOWO2_02_FULL_45_11b]|uniref:GP-PDE domain-containing protein n=1 Tax=Candidatus Kaiserbacteria bacterium RIFCSPLOWO2_12_FULL_45_26 TaxID=1798525 RepID=A0A1F6FHN6_9BACT|nr:MAG: hypothetical protein A2Z56_02220 [Candidatus Kaiserbacteria bacterium RIFCSPHIGHO2_12_45_16]OGG70165.1 MAG: hypothetical protein A2929_03725 [Candidatus Kaiserbacteria bacterium RIFCSPLOWO2_01_FULL_45_25]OGG81834.1 MAG: hypothetical protein A3I99_01985 [Candidatus Kaiserbacteria bacterium RIFCSPLOWO2_02_FULL_45_11b]OGG85336.1 MAG: hypothetical protein A3G90_04785 [Candidatus Kaiserbacteria bacterium RIFCSPLOWO2_12_FULL_45_26]
MKIFAHRVNTLEKLARVPQHFGVEIDIRGWGERMLLNHDPLKSDIEYVDLETFLEAYVDRGLTGGIILNLKEAGYEQVAMDLVESYGISDYFLLDVEFPYLYRATRKEGVRKIAVRYSEAEPIEAVEAQVVDGQPLLDWVWIDTNTQLPLDADIVRRLQGFKTCLVCPERWGRPADIAAYVAEMKALNFSPTAVMTSLEEAPQWEASGL